MSDARIGTNVWEIRKPVDNFGEVDIASDAVQPRIPQGFHN
jgi:hypothetical protein